MLVRDFYVPFYRFGKIINDRFKNLLAFLGKNVLIIAFKAVVEQQIPGQNAGFFPYLPQGGSEGRLPPGRVVNFPLREIPIPPAVVEK